MRDHALLILMISGGAVLSPVAGQVRTELPILTRGQAEAGFAVGLDSNDHRRDWLADPDPSPSGNGLAMKYPGGASSPGIVFITAGPPKPRDLKNRRENIDVSGYQAMIIELRTDSPSTDLSIGIKDADDEDYGYEPKVSVSLSSEWQTVYLPLTWFRGVDLKRLYAVAEFVFVGSQPRNVYVRNIKYTRADDTSKKFVPHIIFGGGWSSTLYFTNTGGAPREFRVDFVAPDGVPLRVPVASGTSGLVGVSVFLPPRTTSTVELPNSGPLSHGYALIAMPPDVVGLGSIRQSIQGQPDLQGLFPFSVSGVTQSSFVWDESDSVTSLSLVNTVNVDSVAQISIRNDAGQLIATASLDVRANSKAAVILRELPGLSGMAGRRGFAEITVRNGSIAVLPFRNGAVSLAAIPTVELTSPDASLSTGSR